MPSPVYNNYANIITFSRGTNATLTDSTGKITYAPNNLLLQSQTFQTTWSTTGLNTSGTPAWVNVETAPDGTMTAERLIEDTSTGLHRIFQTIVIPAGRFVFSFYVKANNRQWAYIYADTGIVSGTINFVTNTYVPQAGSAICTSTPVGNDWYRVNFTYSNTSTASQNIQIWVAQSGTVASYTGDGTSGVYIWGAQLEPVTYQTTPSTYVATTTAAYYGPRLDYDPVTLAVKGLLVEEGRTNLALQSSDIMTTWTTTGAFGNWAAITRTADQYTAPDGTLTADQISGTGAQRKISQRISVSPSTTYTFSIWVKCVSGSFQLDLATGNSNVLVSPSVATSSILTPATTPNFTRYSVTYTVPASGVNQLEIGVVTTDAGSCVGGIWGAQLEVGSFATSYIPTTTASVARSADVASLSGTNFSSWFNANAGTWVVQADQTAFNTTLISTLIGADSGLFNPLYVGAAQNGRASDGTNFPITSNTISAAVPFKLSNSYVSNALSVCLNGGAVASSGYSGAFSTITTMYIGSGNSGTAFRINGHIKSITYYPRQLSSAQLQALTS